MLGYSHTWLLPYLYSHNWRNSLSPCHSLHRAKAPGPGSLWRACPQQSEEGIAGVAGSVELECRGHGTGGDVPDVCAAGVADAGVEARVLIGADARRPHLGIQLQRSVLAEAHVSQIGTAEFRDVLAPACYQCVAPAGEDGFGGWVSAPHGRRSPSFRPHEGSCPGQKRLRPGCCRCFQGHTAPHVAPAIASDERVVCIWCFLIKQDPPALTAKTMRPFCFCIRCRRGVSERGCHGLNLRVSPPPQSRQSPARWECRRGEERGRSRGEHPRTPGGGTPTLGDGGRTDRSALRVHGVRGVGLVESALGTMSRRFRLPPHRGPGQARERAVSHREAGRSRAMPAPLGGGGRGRGKTSRLSRNESPSSGSWSDRSPGSAFRRKRVWSLLPGVDRTDLADGCACAPRPEARVPAVSRSMLRRGVGGVPVRVGTRAGTRWKWRVPAVSATAWCRQRMRWERAAEAGNAQTEPLCAPGYRCVSRPPYEAVSAPDCRPEVRSRAGGVGLSAACSRPGDRAGEGLRRRGVRSSLRAAPPGALRAWPCARAPRLA